jgi:hypothetical protein
MFTTMRSSLVAPISVTSSFQSPPVTEKTVPSVVSRDDEYGSINVVIGMTCAHQVPESLHLYIPRKFHPMHNLYAVGVLANHLASKFL